MSVPQLWDAALLPLAGEESFQNRRYLVRIGAHEEVSAYGTCLGTLGVVAKCHTRHMHHCCLLGDAARIGDDCQRVLHQIVKLQISQWVYHLQVISLYTMLPKHRCRTRMYRENNRQTVYIVDNSLHGAFQFLNLIDIGRTMQRLSVILFWQPRLAKE